MIPTLGASGSLMAAAAGSLLAVSTVVAFQGWPDIADVTTLSPQSLLVAAPASVGGLSSSGADGVRALPALVLSQAGGSGSPARRRSLKVGGDRSVAGTGSRPVAPVPATTPSPPIATSRVPIAVTPAPAAAGVPAGRPVNHRPVRRPADGVRQTTGVVGGRVKQVTQELGGAVSPALPGIGKVVQDTGELLSNTVKNTGLLLGGVVDGLLGAGVPASPANPAAP